MKSRRIPTICALAMISTGALAAQTPVSFLEGRGVGNGSGNAMVVADFNNDGHLDIAEVDYGYGLNIFLGNGDGSFTQLPTLAVFGNLNNSCIAVADFNGDGRLDLVLSGYGNDLVVLLGRGDGTFDSPIQLSTLGGMVATGDFNGDGVPDIAFEFDSGGPAVQVFFGDGTGGFVAGPVTTLGNYVVHAMIAGDLDQDGVDDLAVAVSTSLDASDGYVEVLLGTYDGSFLESQIAVGTGNSLPSSLAAADFNGDGFIDLAVGDQSQNSVSILLGSQLGFVAKPIRIAAPPGTNSLAVADLNGDGIPDLVAGSSTAQAFVYFGKGDGALSFQRELVTWYASSQIALADLTGDGSLYLVSANSAPVTTFGPPEPALTVMRSTAPGRFLTAEAYPAGPSPGSLTVADFNGDGKPDVAVVSETGASVFLGEGNGRLRPPLKSPVSAHEEVAAADVNNDGKLDLVVVGGSSVQTLLGNGDGTFQAPIVSPCPLCGAALVVADVNHDGKPDVITAGGSGIAVLLGNGDGTFQTASIYSIYKPSSIAAADLNGDGNLDLVVTRGFVKYKGGGVYILFGHSDGTFGSAVPLNDAGSGAIIADFNGDGKPDVAMGFNGAIAIYLGNGNGTFGAPLVEGSSVVPPLLAADLNGDGFLDLIANVDQTIGIATILLGHGDGTFTAQSQQYSIASGYPGFTQLATGDFNSDGKPDLISLNPGGNAFWLLLNTTP